MAVLVLDSEALSALARPRNDQLRHQRVRAAMRSAHGRNYPVRVPSAVLVELYRGAGVDEAIDTVLARGFLQVITTGVRIARVAGHLLAGVGAGSEMAIDALVVATAIRLGGGLVITHDPGDLNRLAANHPNVTIAAI
ncbi:MAG: type II toxin-antitoxin system VapC family toxin [Actinomycetia bacterium]|nr:type II toxin-antitoxin system VapC family toxin [Actinomycetes bacterium]